MSKRKIRIKKILLWSVLAMVLVLLSANLWVVWQTNSQMYDLVDELPVNDVALVLGTSKRLVGGEENPYFNSRMKAAFELYKQGKVKHLLLSGDNRTVYYNEPKDMKEALVALGVKAEDITMDHAGLRTLDSIVRCHEIFGQETFTVITQKFHAHRALFIAHHNQLNVSAYMAESPPISFSWKVQLREIFARPLAVIDLYILGKSPEFEGDQEFIQLSE